MMTRAFFIALATLLFSVAAPAQSDDFQKTLAEHQLLKRYLGHMTFEKMSPGPDPEIQGKGALEGKMLGPYFLILEWSGEIYDKSFKALQTCGYDVNKKAYVGTWIDSMVNYLWHLEGHFDPKANTFRIEGSGPGPFGITKFREIHRYQSGGRIEITAMMYEDEEWVPFMITKLTPKP